MRFLLTLVPTLASIAITFSGIFVLGRARKKRVVLYFFLFTVSLAIWSLSMLFGAKQIESGELSLLTVRANMIFAVLQCWFFLEFAHTAANHHTKAKIYAVTILALFTITLCLTPWVFKSIESVNGMPVPIPGTLMPIFALTTVSFIFLGFRSLIVLIKSKHGHEKKQWLITTTALAIMFVLMLTFSFFFVVFLKDTTFIPLAPLFILPAVLIVAFNLSRYGLMGVGLTFPRNLLTVSTVVIVLLLG